MKFKKIFVTLALGLCGFIGFAGEVFGAGTWIGVVKNNTVQFFEQIDTTWRNVPNSDMTLPAGYEEVFAAGTWIGVVKNNTIQFFEQIGTTWRNVPNSDMTLPAGYKEVFESLFFYFGIVANNSISFYNNNGNSWLPLPNITFKIQ